MRTKLTVSLAAVALLAALMPAVAWRTVAGV